ncbi:MAG TPA: aldo/keto reductase [Acidimicrobiales bacterium]|nr:aldo/keto reductase [Acidimicrobiales bacterium]
MNRRPLGRTGIEVSEVGLGTWELLGDVWGAKDDDRSLAALRAGLEAGATFVDTAADYGSGHVEDLLGRLLSAGAVGRDDVVLATKVRPECMVWAPPPERPIHEFFRPAWIRAECEASLRRLRTDHVDVLYLHTWSRSWGHEDDWYAEMARLKEEGKIRAVGISVPDLGVADANVAVARGQVDVVQCVYSVFQQEPESSLFPLAARFGVGVVARSPFSSGALVQRWTPGMQFPEGDWRASWPQEVQRDWVAEQARMAALVDGVVATSELDRPSFCLRFVLDSPSVASVIPGSADPDHVRANAGASGRAPVAPALRAQLGELWRQRRIRGVYNGSG